MKMKKHTKKVTNELLSMTVKQKSKILYINLYKGPSTIIQTLTSLRSIFHIHVTDMNMEISLQIMKSVEPSLDCGTFIMHLVN